MMTSFSYQGQDIPLKYKPNQRAKRLSLRFSVKETSFVLTVPPRVSQTQISLFLQKCKGWAENQLKKLETKMFIRPGEKICIHGNFFECVTDPLRRKPVFCSLTQTLFLPLRWSQKDIHALFKDVAFGILTPYVEAAASHLGQIIEKVSIRDTKSRWGSCSARKTVSLSWRLLFAPPEVAQYVCIHEAVHLIHMNHSPIFWKTVESLCPAYRFHKKWLKINGPSLMQI
jgi:predicted metal-dependent hydrolase